jgi:hypothetical protein
VGLRFGCPIEGRFESGNHVTIRAIVRSWCAGGWHLACAELARNLLQRLRGVADTIDVEPVEDEAGGLEPGVMAGNAVRVDERARRKRIGGANTWNGWLRNLGLRDGRNRRQGDTERRKRSSQQDPSLNEKRAKSTDYRAGKGTASFSSSERAALRMFFIA